MPGKFGDRIRQILYVCAQEEEKNVKKTQKIMKNYEAMEICVCNGVYSHAKAVNCTIVLFFLWILMDAPHSSWLCIPSYL